MTLDPRDWHAVATTKLERVLGKRQGDEVIASVLGELGMDSISSAAALRAFADALQLRGGFAGTVGALLSVHATIHDDQAAPRPLLPR